MRSFRRWLFRLFIVTLVGLVLFGAWAAYCDYRSEAAWMRYRGEAEARGVTFDIKSFTFDNVPEAENFAAIPLFAGRVKEVRAGQTARDPLAIQRPTNPGDDALFLDWDAYLAGWCDALVKEGILKEEQRTSEPARDVLRALDKFEPEMRQLRAARGRPVSRFTIPWERGTLAVEFPHLGVAMSAARILRLRMLAHLVLGESAAAYEDFRDGLRLYAAMREDPALICGLVRFAVLTMIQAPVQCGVIRHAWAERELRRIADDLRTVDVLRDHCFAINSERAYGNTADEELRRLSPTKRIKTVQTIEANRALLGMSGGVDSWLLAFFALRLSWAYDNQLFSNRLLDEEIARFDLDQGRYLFGGDELTSALSQWQRTYLSGALSFGEIASQTSVRAVFLQSQVQGTRAACAIERFRVAHGEYPENLDVLVPEFIDRIPNDPAADGPMTYRKSEDGTFRLYSVGANRIDDGGSEEIDRTILGPCRRRDWVLGVPMK